MGLFGWGEKDQSTPQERKDWRDNAKAQMGKDKESKNPKSEPEDNRPPRHARWW